MLAIFGNCYYVIVEGVYYLVAGVCVIRMSLVIYSNIECDAGRAESVLKHVDSGGLAIHVAITVQSIMSSSLISITSL